MMNKTQEVTVQSSSRIEDCWALPNAYYGFFHLLSTQLMDWLSTVGANLLVS